MMPGKHTSPRTATCWMILSRTSLEQRTTGLTWDRLTDGTNGIPKDFPTRVIREDVERAGLLFAGTEFGIFVSFDDGESWHGLQQNLPVTPITDMKVIGNDLVISTMGRSFWILDNLTPLRSWTSEVSDSPFYVFPVTDGVLSRDRSGRRSETDPEYKSPGVVIDYFVGAGSTDVVRIDILDDGRRTIRSYASDSSETDLAKEQGMREPPLVTVTDQLSAATGFQRFIWDMRHYGASNLRDGRSRGPLAKPGN